MADQKQADKNQYLELNTGAKMPVLGLGTWKSAPGKVENAVEVALKCGYRHIDGAFVYGNEKEVGVGLKKCFDEGVCKREEVFVTTKLWNQFHAAKDVKPALQKSLDLLGLKYVDLYLIHWPVGMKNTPNTLFPYKNDKMQFDAESKLEDLWKAMESLVDEGLTKAIGLSNFGPNLTDQVLKICKIKPAVNQCECHPYLIQEDLIKYCKDKGIIFTAYSPLGSPDRPWAKKGDPSLLDDPKLVEISKTKNKSVAQMLIRFQVERGVVVIPKSVTPDRIKQNFDVWDMKLTDEDMKTVKGFNRDWRACAPKWIPQSKEEKYPYLAFD